MKISRLLLGGAVGFAFSSVPLLLWGDFHSPDPDDDRATGYFLCVFILTTVSAFILPVMAGFFDYRRKERCSAEDRGLTR